MCGSMRGPCEAVSEYVSSGLKLNLPFLYSAARCAAGLK